MSHRQQTLNSRPLALAIERAWHDGVAVPLVRQARDVAPGLTMSGGVTAAVEDAVIDALAGTELSRAEAVRRKAAELRQRRGRGQPLEAVLVDRVVRCWLQVGRADQASCRSTRTRPWRRAWSGSGSGWTRRTRGSCGR